MSRLEKLIEASADPQTTVLRMERLLEQDDINKRVNELSPDLLKDLISIVSISKFLTHYLIRHPYAVSLIGSKANLTNEIPESVSDFNTLRNYKYEELLKITWMDVSGKYDYSDVLAALSILAVNIVNRALQLCMDTDAYNITSRSLSIMALGKLGANELNYSSDIDLIFVATNPGENIDNYQDLQQMLFDSIRKLSRALEEKTIDGFLYRVDLKLRPWGQSGPLVMSIDDTENYYAASSEPWERFALLRARTIAGSVVLGNEFLKRLQSYIFMRSLSTDDLGRFIEIKNEMSKVREKDGHWNIKVGEGGIRDIEFFIQVLQLVNAGSHELLQKTNTMEILTGLNKSGFISSEEAKEIRHSYLFLRRLENRLQMVDEQQTHDLPDAHSRRVVLARSLTSAISQDDELLENFERELNRHQTVAKTCFDRILPDGELQS